VKLGWNLTAGFANSFWTAIVGLAAVPFYLRYLGIEAYGLIGFFTAMQALFALLEMGMSQTINREVARSASVDERLQARDLLHTLALAYWGVAALIALVTLAGAPLIGRYWLNSTAIPSASVTRAVMLMGLIVACRFPLGLYLGALMGAQRMVVASGIEMTMVTISNVGAIAILAFVSPTIQAFFVWQALIGLLNVAAVRAAAWRAVRIDGGERPPRFDAAALQRIWRFSAGMGVTAVLGTIFMQSDKILLSKIVSLEELGRYTLAGFAARSLYLFIVPVFTAIYPRFAALHATGEFGQIELLYRSGTRLMMAILFPLAFFVGVFSVEIFTIWTRDPNLATRISPVVSLLLLGSALHGAMHFPFALQVAYGKAMLPVLINLILLAAFVPLLILLAINFGILGAAAAWAFLNTLYLLLGTALTHRLVLRGVGARWLLGDVCMPLLVSVLVAGVGGYAVRVHTENIYVGLLCGGLLAGVASVLVIALSPDLSRGVRSIISRHA
jgi:O-antigen/teichoic acid export membrane protein